MPQTDTHEVLPCLRTFAHTIPCARNTHPSLPRELEKQKEEGHHSSLCWIFHRSRSQLISHILSKTPFYSRSSKYSLGMLVLLMSLPPHCKSNRWAPNQSSCLALESRCHSRLPSSASQTHPHLSNGHTKPFWSTLYFHRPLSSIRTETVLFSPIIVLSALSTVPGTQQVLNKIFAK